MGKKDRQSMEELWSKRFDEEVESDEEEPLSRKAKREREKSISPILTAFLVFLLLLAILPISAYLWWSSRDSLSEEPTSPAVEQVAENEQNEEPEESDDIVLEDIEESDTRDSEEEESQNESEVAAEADDGSDEESGEGVTGTEDGSEPAASSDETGSDEETTDSSQEEIGNTGSSDTVPAAEEEPAETGDATYYTVEAGDNMYRIALNHGMSTEELMQLNGIQDETVYVGQELRVN
jgi:LysM repeat protein